MSWRLARFLARFPGAGAGPAALFWALTVAILVLPIAAFLVVAVSPRAFDQGSEWFTLADLGAALRGPALHALADSAVVGVATAVLATAVGFAVAWLQARTSGPGRAAWPLVMFALLLAPSYLIALGWERLLERGGVLAQLGIADTGLRHLCYSPLGVVGVLAVKGVPFAYLALSGALRGLGEEFEAAVRVHGGNRRAALRVVLALLAPAVWSALAIVFAESVSDFGVASTLAASAHFPVATFTLFNAIDNEPVQFPVAAAIGWCLMGLAGLALLAQYRALRGRSYQVLGGRRRPARRVRLRPAGRLAAAVGLALFVALALGVPALGAVSASMIQGFGSVLGRHGLTLQNYRRVLHSSQLGGPILLSARLATLTASITVVMGLAAARLLARRRTALAGRVLDLMLLTAVALPGIVFAAGYIFTYNLPVTNALGIHLYETTTLLLLGYLATALPSTSRVLLGSVSQLEDSLREAGRVHGGGPWRSWWATVLPLLARPMVSAWLLTFGATLLELPVSQLLYPPGQPPLSVAITKALANYDYGGGTAMEVLAVLFALGITAVVLGLFRLAAPRGWRQLGRSG